MESENKKIDLGINAILKKKFPDFKIKNRISQEFKNDKLETLEEVAKNQTSLTAPLDTNLNSSRNFTIDLDPAGDELKVEKESTKFKEDNIDIFSFLDSTNKTGDEYEKLYIEKNWQELLEKTNEELLKDKNNYLAKIFWIEANLNLKTIPPEILLGTLDGVEKDIVNDDNKEYIKKFIARTYFNISKRLKDKNELVLDSLAKANEIDSLTYNKHYKHLVKTEYLRLEGLSETLPQNDPIFEKLDYLKNLSQDLQLDLTSRKEKQLSVKIEENKKIIKKQFIVLLFILLTLTFGGYMLYQYMFKIQEQKIPFVSEEVANFDNLINIDIELPSPKPLDLIDSVSLDDLIKEANKDKISNKEQPIIENPISKVIDNKFGNKEKINLTEPKEPKELADLLDGNVPIERKEQEANQQGSNRPPFIVRGDSKRDPIISAGEVSAPELPTNQKIIRVGEEVFSLINTSLYSRPNLLEAELQEIKRNQPMLVIGNFGDWFQVKLRNGRIGYVKKEWVRH